VVEAVKMLVGRKRAPCSAMLGAVLLKRWDGFGSAAMD
jgi:hypothetical protein